MVAWGTTRRDKKVWGVRLRTMLGDFLRRDLARHKLKLRPAAQEAGVAADTLWKIIDKERVRQRHLWPKRGVGLHTGTLSLLAGARWVGPRSARFITCLLSNRHPRRSEDHA